MCNVHTGLQYHIYAIMQWGYLKCSCKNMDRGNQGSSPPGSGSEVQPRLRQQPTHVDRSVGCPCAWWTAEEKCPQFVCAAVCACVGPTATPLLYSGGTWLWCGAHWGSSLSFWDWTFEVGTWVRSRSRIDLMQSGWVLSIWKDGPLPLHLVQHRQCLTMHHVHGSGPTYA